MNKYTKHTPGPWTIDTEGKVTDLDGRVIAPLVHGHNVPSLAYPRGSGQYVAEDDGGAANARLIAAAPDLLKHLKDARAFLDELCGLIHSGAFDAAEDWVLSNSAEIDGTLAEAIAKVEGDQ